MVGVFCKAFCRRALEYLYSFDTEKEMGPTQAWMRRHELLEISGNITEVVINAVVVSRARFNRRIRYAAGDDWLPPV